MQYSFGKKNCLLVLLALRYFRLYYLEKRKYFGWFKYLNSGHGKKNSKFLVKIFIKVPFLKRWLNRKVSIIDNINPNEIKIEDISKFYFIPKFMTKFLCFLACRQGDFKKNVNGTYKLK